MDAKTAQQEELSASGAASSQPQDLSPPKLRELIGRADKVYDKKTRKFRLHKRSTPRDRSQRFERFVIISARIFSFQGAPTNSYEVQIRGPLLCEELNKAFGLEADVNFNKNVELSESNLKTMYHALAKLEERQRAVAQTEDTANLRFELKAGVEFIQEHWSHVWEEMKSVSKEEVRFDHLWTLFPPACLVTGIDELKQTRVYRLRSCRYQDLQDGSQEFVIAVDYLDSDGRRIGYVKKETHIKAFRSSVVVRELALYPFELHQHYEDERANLLKRAEKALELQGPGQHLQEYHGHALEYSGPRKFNSHGRVMLDPILHKQVCPHSSLVPDIRRSIQREDLTVDHKLILTSVLYGFSLGDKTWGAFAVDRLSKVNWDPLILESVVLDGEKKSFLRSLIETHSSSSNKEAFDDIVRDKGKGLIGLLSGPPGVGKTLTAEAVAEVAKRPLMSLSSGEMGDSSVSVERRLNSELELAEAWRAVLLLDEADVFMAKRDEKNMVQNAITSVFLRKLEYYQGILLLTTNRLDSVDPAFRSRIHFCFHYVDLDDKARGLIWQTFLAKAAAKGDMRIELSDEERKSLAGRRLNGRQIKNIVSVSRAYALQNGNAISLNVVEMAANFSQFPADSKEGSEEGSKEGNKDGLIDLI